MKQDSNTRLLDWLDQRTALQFLGDSLRCKVDIPCSCHGFEQYRLYRTSGGCCFDSRRGRQYEPRVSAISVCHHITTIRDSCRMLVTISHHISYSELPTKSAKEMLGLYSHCGVRDGVVSSNASGDFAFPDHRGVSRLLLRALCREGRRTSDSCHHWISRRDQYSWVDDDHHVMKWSG